MSRLFGTDGVRGLANTELTPELAYRLGRSAAYFFGREHTCPEFIIGRDTRISGQMFEAALAAGICSAGGKAIIVGVIPTPAVAYLTMKNGAQAGIVISASHNSFGDNGIKFFAANGYKLSDETEDHLAELALAEVDSVPRPVGEKIGVIEYQHDLVSQYIEHVLGTVRGDFRGLKIVVDCSNGAAYETAPILLRSLGAELIVINDKPNGTNINDNCGSTHMTGLQQAVVAHGANIGIAHDGDADRCLAVDEKGNIVDGDAMMVICAIDLLQQKKLRGNTLVVTVMSNIGLHKAIKDVGGKLVVTPVGDRYVIESMVRTGFTLGGEQSGHIIFGEYATTGDGLITALQLISALRDKNLRMSELAAVMTTYPQVLENVKVKSKQGWQENIEIANAISQAEINLRDNGRILVRPSGTEPLIRVMAEGPILDELKQIVQSIVDIIKKELS